MLYRKVLFRSAIVAALSVVLASLHKSCGCVEAWVIPKSTSLTKFRFSSQRQSWRGGVTSTNLQATENSPVQADVTASTVTTGSGGTTTQRDDLVRQVLRLGRQYGPIGNRQPEQCRAQILEAALALAPHSDPAPARIPLSGVHRLVYSDSTGASSGTLFGPVHGLVTQEFVNATAYINAVTLGPLTLSVLATRRAQNDTVLTVTFHSLSVTLFGNTLLTKEIVGGGTWDMVFAGTVMNEAGDPTLVRMLRAPSLFIIEQPVVRTDPSLAATLE
jgi:hypothetical protein